MKYLFVTSFEREMFAATGAVLVISWLDYVSDSALLVCHENLGSGAMFRHPPLLQYDLGDSELLRQWLRDHRDIIPRSAGGEAGPCLCPDSTNPFGAHQRGCHWQWFNKNASRWFRKVVSLDYALRFPGFDALVWVDSDCRFQAPLAPDEVERWFRGKSVFYLKSPDRHILESGVLGIRATAAGKEFIRATMDRYRSGVFRADERWDDAFQFQQSLAAHPKIDAVDIATCATGTKPFGDVVSNSPLSRYLVHRKGFHGSKLGLMR